MARFFTDIEVIQNIKQGEVNKALNYLYFKHEKETIRWIRKNNGSREEAQDIFQESILAFYQYVMQEKYDTKYPIGAFILKISKNKWINRAKQLKKQLNQTDNMPELVTQDEFLFTENIDKQKLVQEILSQIGETCQELLTYSIFYDISMKDIATKMGFSSSNVAKTKNYKCKKRLEKILNENPQLKQQLFT